MSQGRDRPGSRHSHGVKIDMGGKATFTHPPESRHMTGDVDLRARWRARWLASIREISDVREQRATWLNPENDNPHFSFVECLCSYFDALGLDDPAGRYEARVDQGMVTREEVNAVVALHAKLSDYSPPAADDYDHDAILRDPAWLAVVDEARWAVDRLKTMLSDDELIILSRSGVEGLDASRTAGEA
jgi:hypothetical protein